MSQPVAMLRADIERVLREERVGPARAHLETDKWGRPTLLRIIAGGEVRIVHLGTGRHMSWTDRLKQVRRACRT